MIKIVETTALSEFRHFDVITIDFNDVIGYITKQREHEEYKFTMITDEYNKAYIPADCGIVAKEIDWYDTYSLSNSELKDISEFIDTL